MNWDPVITPLPGYTPTPGYGQLLPHPSPLVASGVTGPDDLAIAPMPARRATLLVGRGGHPFRALERRQLLSLARIADRLPALGDLD